MKIKHRNRLFSKRLISVFFFVLLTLILTTCGIPSYFYLSSSSYWSTTVTPFTEEETGRIGYTCKFQILDADQAEKIEEGAGPQIVLLYTVSDLASFSSSTLSSNLISYFGSQIKRANSTYDGRNVPTGGKVLTSDYTNSTLTTGTTYHMNLYPFLEDGARVSTGEYHVLSPDTVEQVNFDIYYDPASNELKLQTLLQDGETAYGEESVLGRPYTTTGGSHNFYVPTTSLDTSNTENPDLYGGVSTSFSSSQIHVYWALTPGREGRFSNTFWTTLYYLGSFDLSLFSAT